MADIITKINGEVTTLVDNGDGTYRIDLATTDARKFVRGELDQIRAALDTAVNARDASVATITRLVEQRLSEVAVRDALAAEIDALRINRDELIAWLQGFGDPT